jgi:hypothetical protein
MMGRFSRQGAESSSQTMSSRELGFAARYAFGMDEEPKSSMYRVHYKAVLDSLRPLEVSISGFVLLQNLSYVVVEARACVVLRVPKPNAARQLLLLLLLLAAAATAVYVCMYVCMYVLLLLLQLLAAAAAAKREC